MNQEKVGKFILELRKEKNMTQQELARKIGVTDRAISKWENGRGMPDLSLMKPLCKELGISINELISGEKIDEKVYNEKLEENIINAIDYTSKKIKSNNKIFKIIITIIILSVVILISMFLVDVRMMNYNKPVIFSTWGFKYTPAIKLNEVEIEASIKEYIVERRDNEIKHHKGEKTFVSMRIYLLEEKGNIYNIYAWVRDGKYYLDNGELKEDSASSIPHKFIVEKKDNDYVVVNYSFPKDGSYHSDMKKIFPRSVRNDMSNVYFDGTSERLSMEVLEQAKLYFHK